MARYTGAFSDVSAIDLAAHASKEAIRRSNVDPGEFDHAILGTSCRRARMRFMARGTWD